MKTDKPDERQIMTYVSCFYHAFQGAMQVNVKAWKKLLTYYYSDGSVMHLKNPGFLIYCIGKMDLWQISLILAILEDVLAKWTAYMAIKLITKTLIQLLLWIHFSADSRNPKIRFWMTDLVTKNITAFFIINYQLKSFE